MSQSDPSAASFADTTSAAETAREGQYPGILLFNTSLQMLFVSSKAESLLQRLLIGRLESSSSSPPWTEISSLAEQLLIRSQQCTDLRETGRVEIRRVMASRDVSLLVHGYVIPGHFDQRDKSQLLLLLVLEGPGPSANPGGTSTAKRFFLTGREQAIVHGLFEGLTNKQIASQLGLTENTVKKYLQRIMFKTSTSTRSGVVGRILSATNSTQTPRQ